MRDLVVFAIIVAVGFFGIGEWRGWYLGIPPQTPVYAYKVDHEASYKRRTTSVTEFPFQMTGVVKRGKLTVEGYYERTSSFQSGARGERRRLVYKREFQQGEAVDIDWLMRQGMGLYSIRLVLEDASGTFRLNIPNGNDL